MLLHLGGGRKPQINESRVSEVLRAAMDCRGYSHQDRDRDRYRRPALFPCTAWRDRPNYGTAATEFL